MTDRDLQYMFEGKTINLNGVKRNCYYCTLEDGGAWVWLRPTLEDKCRRLNFVVWDEYKLEHLHKHVLRNEKLVLSDYGYLSKQK